MSFMNEELSKEIMVRSRLMNKYLIDKTDEYCCFFCFFFINWDSPHARLNSHYEAWSYKKKSTKNITGYRKSV